MGRIVAVALLVALLLSTAVFVGLGLVLAGLLSIILSIPDRSRWRHRMQWAVPVIGGIQVLTSVGVYVAGLRTSSTGWVVFLPFLAVPILFSGLVLLLSPLLDGAEARGDSRSTRSAAVLAIVFGLILCFPGIFGIGALITMAIKGEQVAIGALVLAGVCSAMTSPGGIICIVHGLRSLKRAD
jgi:hypothetical protein